MLRDGIAAGTTSVWSEGIGSRRIRLGGARSPPEKASFISRPYQPPLDSCAGLFIHFLVPLAKVVDIHEAFLPFPRFRRLRCGECCHSATLEKKLGKPRVVSAPCFASMVELRD
jgi:hypothetical protein